MSGGVQASNGLRPSSVSHVVGQSSPHDDVPAFSKYWSDRGASSGVDTSIVNTNRSIDDLVSTFDDQKTAWQFLGLLQQANQLSGVVQGTPTDLNPSGFFNLGQPSQYLDSVLVDGGSSQLQAYRQYRHDMNVQTAYEMFAEQGKSPSDAELQQTVQALDDMVALEILKELKGAQDAGTLSSKDAATGVMYQGIDVLHEVQFNQDNIDTIRGLTPENVAAMTDEEATQTVDSLLGADGGGAAISTRRDQLRGDPAALASFDRGLLTTIGVTVKAAQADKQYAEQIGINTDGHREIPAKYRGSLLMMIAYVFAQREMDLEKKLQADVEDFDSMNKDLSLDGDKGNKSLENSISGRQLEIQVDVKQIQENMNMASSLISDLGDAESRPFRG